MRTLFKKAGFQTYLVDEFRTSCRCSKCEIGICKKPIYLFKHTDLHYHTLIKRIDDILYNFGFPHIINVFTFVIVFLIVLKKGF